MKKTIFAIFVLLLFIGMGVGEQIYINKLFDKIYDYANETLNLVMNGEMEEALKLSKEARETWEAQKHFAEAIISHNETREVSIRLSELEGYIVAEDDKSAVATAMITAELCKNLEHVLAFKWDTIL